jgi:hypothetical protein
MRYLTCGIALLLCGAALFAESAIPDDPYDILKGIPSFYELFAQNGLAAYSADVKIEGAVTKTLSDLAAEKGLPVPEFIEYYREKEGFSFRLKNMNYPPLLKQMIGEIFMPVQIFDRVISLIESKRELGWFQNFKAVTQVEAKWIQYQETPHIKLAFIARPGELIETREEGEGAAKKTVETTAMTFIVQPSGKMIRMLKVYQTEKTSAGETKVEKKFLFDYTKIGTRWMPSELRIEKNNTQEVRFRAGYTTSGGFTIFAEKIFEFSTAAGKPEQVRLLYRNYTFNKNVNFKYLEDGSAKGGALPDEAEAEKLFNKAKDCIINGKTAEAKSLLKKVIKDYSATSYAEQSKTLLSGLPE